MFEKKLKKIDAAAHELENKVFCTHSHSLNNEKHKFKLKEILKVFIIFLYFTLMPYKTQNKINQSVTICANILFVFPDARTCSFVYSNLRNKNFVYFLQHPQTRTDTHTHLLK